MKSVLLWDIHIYTHAYRHTHVHTEKGPRCVTVHQSTFQQDICTYAWWMVDFPNWIKFQLKIYIFCDVFRLLFILSFVCTVCGPAKMKLKTPFVDVAISRFAALNISVNVHAGKHTDACVFTNARNNEFNWIEFISLWKPKLNCDSVKIPTFTHFTGVELSSHVTCTPKSHCSDSLALRLLRITDQI